MSFIPQVMKCEHCNFHFNVVLGTFGYGLPNKCPQCGYLDRQFAYVINGSKTEEELKVLSNKKCDTPS